MSDEVNAAAIVGQGWCKPFACSYNTRDLITYAIGIGSKDLRYIYEKDRNFAPFPTYPIVLAFKGDASDVVGFPSPAMIAAGGGRLQVKPKGAGLDAERYIEILRPLPKKGDFFLKQRTIGVHDKGRGALVENESVLTDKNGVEYVKMISGGFMMNVTGFKSAGVTNSQKITPPSRAPDAVVEERTSIEQAQIYRLSGDYNPLHVDPKFAKAFGFKEPILHGLCTMGHAARHVLKEFGDNDAARFKSIKVRFSSPVLPGNTLVTKMWKEGNRVIFVTTVKETGKTVINNAAIELKNPSSKL